MFPVSFQKGAKNVAFSAMSPLQVKIRIVFNVHFCELYKWDWKALSNFYLWDYTAKVPPSTVLPQGVILSNGWKYLFVNDLS